MAIDDWNLAGTCPADIQNPQPAYTILEVRVYWRMCTCTRCSSPRLLSTQMSCNHLLLNAIRPPVFISMFLITRAHTILRFRSRQKKINTIMYIIAQYALPITAPELPEV